MSTADDARDLTETDFQTFDPKQTFGYSYGYTDGYRRALEDAADALERRGQPSAIAPPHVWAWLRDRAAGVGTKDGDDDE